MAIDLDAPLRFLHTAFRPDDWIAVLLKSHDTGGTAQRVGPMSLIASPKFQAWLRAENARRFSVFVSVNAIRPQRKARTRDAVGEIRHVFLDADRNGPSVLAGIAGRGDLPPPSCVVHTSPKRLHVLWRVSGFAKEQAEPLQKQLAAELGTDKVATSCAQVTRIPGFFNHKYRPGPLVTAECSSGRRTYELADFPTVPTQNPRAAQESHARGAPPVWTFTSGPDGTLPRSRQLWRETAATQPRSASVAAWCVASTLRRTTRWQCSRIGIAPANRHGPSPTCGRSCRRPGAMVGNPSAACLLRQRSPDGPTEFGSSPAPPRVLRSPCGVTQDLSAERRTRSLRPNVPGRSEEKRRSHRFVDLRNRIESADSGTGRSVWVSLQRTGGGEEWITTFCREYSS